MNATKDTGTTAGLPTPLEARHDQSGAAGPRVATLLVRLAERVREDGAVPQPPSPGVLLDLVLDDVRYLLVWERSSEMQLLSPRERQVAQMVAEGRTNHAIGSALEISVWTVSTHLRRIFAKLGVATRAEMVAHLLGPHGHGPAPDDPT